MPPKKKPDTAGYQKLKKDLADQRPGQLYILHGEETYLRDYYLGRLREQLLTGGMGTFNFHQIEPKDMSPHALEEAIDCLPMMGERTMVQVTDFDLFKCGEQDREGYTKLFSQLPDYVCVVFVYDLIDYKGDARTKLAAAIKEHGTVANFVRQDQGDLVDWVRRRFRELYRLHKPEMQPGFDVILVARGRAVRSTYQQLDETYLHLLRQAGLVPEDFEIYTTYEASTFCKPNPAYYLEVARTLGVKPEECLMVGNDATEDMAAREVGMDVFLLTDCLINAKNRDLNAYPRGDFAALNAYIDALQ